MIMQDKPAERKLREMKRGSVRTVEDTNLWPNHRKEKYLTVLYLPEKPKRKAKVSTH